MTQNSPCLIDDNAKQQSEAYRRTSSRQSRRLDSPHSRSSSHHVAHSKARSPYPLNSHPSQGSPFKSPKSATSSQTHHGPSPLKMVTTTMSQPQQHAQDDAQYYFLPDVDMSSEEASLAWMEPIVINDEDLTWGGKSLSAWYEEERQSADFVMEEEQEEHRGRQRIRQHHPHQRHQHHQNHHHHHPHHHMSSGATKSAASHHEQKKHQL
ncbi:hypothetical protein F5Y17DRAFT_13481 [Xylariaceae sp. FL0594]|nr:hypothetical protein F5Y17DRAFT_13481 [Xylariaceae sp. FL0594]